MLYKRATGPPSDLLLKEQWVRKPGDGFESRLGI